MNDLPYPSIHFLHWPKIPPMDLMDDSYGPAQALRDVWKNHGQQKAVANANLVRSGSKSNVIQHI